MSSESTDESSFSARIAVPRPVASRSSQRSVGDQVVGRHDTIRSSRSDDIWRQSSHRIRSIEVAGRPVRSSPSFHAPMT
ncbi:MAG TPA: hypothetical protein DCQ98_09150 [Planctomycetaceae bacterium]|nr:hypothetical protein [Planctomycetaceae bacterium]